MAPPARAVGDVGGGCRGTADDGGMLPRGPPGWAAAPRTIPTDVPPLSGSRRRMSRSAASSTGVRALDRQRAGGLFQGRGQGGQRMARHDVGANSLANQPINRRRRANRAAPENPYEAPGDIGRALRRSQWSKRCRLLSGRPSARFRAPPHIGVRPRGGAPPLANRHGRHGDFRSKLAPPSRICADQGPKIRSCDTSEIHSGALPP